MPKTNREVEDRVQAAVEKVWETKDPVFSKIAREYNIPRGRLIRRLNGTPSKYDAKPVNRRLTDEQEEAIILYCQFLDEIGAPATGDMLEGAANLLLERAAPSGASPKPVSSCWRPRFIVRHPELHCVKEKSAERERVAACSIDNYMKYFDNLSACLKKYGVATCDIWNMDEIGFRIGVGGSRKVYTLDPEKAEYAPTTTNRESVTIIEAASAGGNSIPPFIILPGQKLFSSWSQNDLDPDAIISTTKSGYTDDIRGLEWIHHFVKHTEKLRKGEYILLLYDGHSSHTTYEFVECCWRNKVIPFVLPSHSTHILQPLDLVVFQPYKHWHREAVSDAARSGCVKYTKEEFLAGLQGFRSKAFKEGTIKKSFAAAGIIPWNPESVLRKLPSCSAWKERHEWEAEQGPPPSSPPPSTPLRSSSPISDPATPKSLRSLGRMKRYLTSATPLTPTRQAHYTNKFIRGSMEQANLAVLTGKMLQETQAAAEARQARQSNKRVIASGVALSARYCRDIDFSKLKDKELLDRKVEHAQFKRTVTERKEEFGWRNVLKDVKAIGRFGQGAWEKRMGEFSRTLGIRDLEYGPVIRSQDMEESVGYGQDFRPLSDDEGIAGEDEFWGRNQGDMDDTEDGGDQ